MANKGGIIHVRNILGRRSDGDVSKFVNHILSVQGGNTAVVFARAGMAVWVQNVRWGGAADVWSSEDSRFATFSGFLL